MGDTVSRLPSCICCSGSSYEGSGSFVMVQKEDKFTDWAAWMSPRKLLQGQLIEIGVFCSWRGGKVAMVLIA